MGLIGNVANRAIKKGVKKNSKEEADIKGANLSQNEKTLKNVFKTIGNAIVQAFSFIIGLIGIKGLLIIVLAVGIMSLLGSLVNVLNIFVEEDTEAAVDLSLMVIADPTFRAEIFEMFANGEEESTIVNTIKQHLVEKGAGSPEGESVQSFAEYVYDVLQEDYNNSLQ